MNIVDTARKLNFSSDEYIVVGSGIMVVLGLKGAKDLDIVVSPRLFQRAASTGWQRAPFTYPDKAGHVFPEAEREFNTCTNSQIDLKQVKFNVPAEDLKLE
jgi:hypothetical protein